MISNLKSSIKRQLITGVIVLLPLGLTLYIGWVLFNLVGTLFLPVVEKVYFLNIYELPLFLNKIISFLITMIIIWVIGLIAANIVGRNLIIFTESLISKVPVIDRIYKIVRQIIQAVAFSKTAFKKVVMIEYPRKGIYSLAFASNSGEIKFDGETNKKVVTVFIPTTPNPTSGWFLIVPEEEIIKINISVEEGMKLIISGGVITPDNFFVNEEPVKDRKG